MLSNRGNALRVCLDLSRYLAVGGLEIGRIYMGNYAYQVLEDVLAIFQYLGTVHGVYYVCYANIAVEC